MLFDPRHDKTPSFSGFALHVSQQAPDKKYFWPNPECCAVAEYLQSIGAYHDRWAREDELTDILDLLNYLARGDAIRAFELHHEENPDWTYGELSKRIDEYRKETNKCGGKNAKA